MNTLYELTTLAFPILSANAVSAGARDCVTEPDAKGELLGCWRTDIGTLARLLVLRGFETPQDLSAERHRALFSANPFNAGSVVTSLEMDSYAPFPFLPPVQTGAYGKVYEFRTYKLKPGGLPPTLAGWEAAMPAREPMSHLVINMYALDGPPRITHIWPYAGVNERFAIRAQSVTDGIWPPRGGPEQILEATSTIALPESYSPLH
jgi:hypothetical protein